MRSCHWHLLSPAKAARTVRIISVRAMQVMLDMMMDLMDRTARETAIIVEKDGQTTLTVHALRTTASLILRNGKDTFSCVTMLEMNFTAYASYRYNNYLDHVCREREGVARAAASPRPPPRTEEGPRDSTPALALSIKEASAAV